MRNIPIQDNALELAIKASIKAGDSILEIYGGKFETRTKSDGSQVTQADMKSNEIIKRHLSTTPYKILSEEDKDDKGRLECDTIWIVDPLDGTMDFIDRTGEFTVMIALVKNKKPVLGVINWPAGGTIFAAHCGRGAFKNTDGDWQRITVTKTSEPSECRAVVSRHHLTEREKKILGRLGIEEFARVGSSLKVGRISSGQAEVYITTTDKMKEWDTAASYCIITEAGGKMTDMQGHDISYNNRIVNHIDGILVTNGRIHDKIVDEFKSSE